MVDTIVDTIVNESSQTVDTPANESSQTVDTPANDSDIKKVNYNDYKHNIKILG